MLQSYKAHIQSFLRLFMTDVQTRQLSSKQDLSSLLTDPSTSYGCHCEKTRASPKKTTEGTSPGTWGSTLRRCNCVGHPTDQPEARSGLGSTLVGTAQTHRLETCQTESGEKRETNTSFQRSPKRTGVRDSVAPVYTPKKISRTHTIDNPGRSSQQMRSLFTGTSVAVIWDSPSPASLGW